MKFKPDVEAIKNNDEDSIESDLEDIDEFFFQADGLKSRRLSAF